MKWIATLLGISLLVALPSGGAFAQQPAGAPAAAQPVLVGSDSLVGSAVRDSDGRDIGKVNRLMIDPNDGRITNLIVATGGTLGMGSNTISVPWSAIKVGQDRGKIIVTANQTLDPAPANRSGSGAEPRRQ
jgi:sporulation protein YlmC with PRC-barrel domain